MNTKMLKTVLVGFVLSVSSVANAGLIDLSNWTATSGGNWILDGTNSSVLQITNGDPTYFLSDTDYINTKFEGTFGVETTGDDDFIGFVFGYNTNDFLLFDWKQLDQGTANSGFTLSHITGGDVDYWAHTGSDISVLASDYSGNNGWANYTTYDFTLDFTTTGISIDINDNNIFTIAGNFQTGKFGFYNYSQAAVRYTGFEETVSPSIDVSEPSSLIIFALGIIGLVSRRFIKA